MCVFLILRTPSSLIWPLSCVNASVFPNEVRSGMSILEVGEVGEMETLRERGGGGRQEVHVMLNIPGYYSEVIFKS